MTHVSLIVPAFIAGLLTFLAPCTLPLVPGYLGFISGVSLADLRNPGRARLARRRIFLNGLLYVVGFSVVFVTVGSVVGWLGGAILAQWRRPLARVGGLLVILFGLYMVESALAGFEHRWRWLKWVRLPFLGWMTHTHRLPGVGVIRPGQPLSSLIFGAVFALGWTPCVGPVLGAILTLAATSAGVREGALLLSVFSLGLAVPFLIVAAGTSFFARHLSRLHGALSFVSFLGGVLLVGLGVLVFTGRLGVWIGLFYRWFRFLNYERLLEYL